MTQGFSTFIRLSIEGDNQFKYWLTYVLMVIAGATAVLQIRYAPQRMAVVTGCLCVALRCMFVPLCCSIVIV